MPVFLRRTLYNEEAPLPVVLACSTANVAELTVTESAVAFCTHTFELGNDVGILFTRLTTSDTEGMGHPYSTPAEGCAA